MAGEGEWAGCKAEEEWEEGFHGLSGELLQELGQVWLGISNGLLEEGLGCGHSD
ncbi:MAG: hypothetical protein ACJA16_003485 [Akkermansiaceae bacterium]|jgi:hypothetical protein